MAAGNPQGWQSKGASDPTRYDATISGYKVGTSKVVGRNLLVTTNRTDGNYDVYEKTTFGNKLLYSYNATNDKIIANQSNLANFKQYFTGVNSGQLTSLHKSVRSATYTLAKNNVTGGPNSISTKDFLSLQQKPGYKFFVPVPAPPKDPAGDPPAADPPQPTQDPGDGVEDSTTASNPNPDTSDQKPYEPVDFMGAGETKLKVDPVFLRYPLANLDAAKELGITYDYIKIRIVDHIASLDLKRLTAAAGVTGTDGNTDSQNANVYSEASKMNFTKLSDAYKRSQSTYAYIVLPMQPNLSSTNSADWGTDSANILQLVGGSIFNSFYGGVGSKGLSMDQIGKLGNNLAQGAQSLIKTGVAGKAEIAALLAGQTVGSNLLTRASGTVINPNLEMLFNGPRLRTFNFTFDMTPRFKEEAIEIKRIIRTLKKYMAPAQHVSSAFLKSPKIFLLDYIYNGESSNEELSFEDKYNRENANAGAISAPKQHPYLNKIKPCALTDISVNYTPDGSYMTYRDGGSMTRYSISLSFSEIEPVYEGDYVDDDKNLTDPGY